MWDDFFALSKRYWYVYVGVLLLEDRVQGWANDQIDKIAPSAAGDAVTTPFLLFIGVIAVLGLLAFLDTRNAHVAASSPSTPETDGHDGLKKERDALQLWVKGIIDAERAAFRLTRFTMECALWNVEMLSADEPYFEIGILFKYHGVLRLVIDEPTGFLSLYHEQFAQEPRFMEPNESLPIDRLGPTGGILRLRQYVTPTRAMGIDVRLPRYDENLRCEAREVEFYTKNYHAPVRLIAPGGEIVFEGDLFGEYLTVLYKPSKLEAP